MTPQKNAGAMTSRRLTRGGLQHLEDAMHERHLLCVKGIGCMLGMVTILTAGFTAVHHLHLTTTAAISCFELQHKMTH